MFGNVVTTYLPLVKFQTMIVIKQTTDTKQIEKFILASKLRLLQQLHGIELNDELQAIRAEVAGYVTKNLAGLLIAK